MKKEEKKREEGDEELRGMILKQVMGWDGEGRFLMQLAEQLVPQSPRFQGARQRARQQRQQKGWKWTGPMRME